MAIGGLNSLKPWDQPSDEVADPGPVFAWRNVDVDEIVTFDENRDQALSFEGEGIVSVDPDGEYFFVQLNGHPTDGTEYAWLDAEGEESEEADTGYLLAIAANDYSTYSDETVPVGRYMYYGAARVLDHEAFYASWRTQGVTLVRGSDYGVFLTISGSGYFVYVPSGDPGVQL